jgi:hypothetical protein
VISEKLDDDEDVVTVALDEELLNPRLEELLEDELLRPRLEELLEDDELLLLLIDDVLNPRLDELDDMLLRDELDCELLDIDDDEDSTGTGSPWLKSTANHALGCEAGGASSIKLPELWVSKSILLQKSACLVKSLRHPILLSE